jgi:hypothetical protein
MEVIEFEGKTLEVIIIETEDYDYILYKDKNSNDYYLSILKNHSFMYYEKVAKVDSNDIFDFYNGKIQLKYIVDKYR